MLKNLQNNENGLVFVTVLMIVVVIMTITVGIISLNVSQVTFAESEVQRLKTEMLAMGTLAYVFANQMTSSGGSPVNIPPIDMDGVTYTISATIDYATDDLTIVINY